RFTGIGYYPPRSCCVPRSEPLLHLGRASIQTAAAALAPDEAVEDVVHDLRKRQQRYHDPAQRTELPRRAEEPRPLLPDAAVPAELLDVRHQPERREKRHRPAREETRDEPAPALDGPPPPRDVDE